MTDCKITHKDVMTAIAAAAKVTKTSPAKIKSESRIWPVVEARMLTVLALHDLGLSDYKIACLINRGRSSVCKSRKTARLLLNLSKTFQAKYQKISSLIS